MGKPSDGNHQIELVTFLIPRFYFCNPSSNSGTQPRWLSTLKVPTRHTNLHAKHFHFDQVRLYPSHIFPILPLGADTLADTNFLQPLDTFLATGSFVCIEQGIAVLLDLIPLHFSQTTNVGSERIWITTTPFLENWARAVTAEAFGPWYQLLAQVMRRDTNFEVRGSFILIRLHTR